MTRPNDRPDGSPGGTTTVLVVGGRPVDPMARATGIEVVSVESGDPAPDDADCVVDATDGRAPAVETAAPVVAYTNRDPGTVTHPGYDAYVGREADPDRLLETVRWVLAREGAGGPDAADGVASPEAPDAGPARPPAAPDADHGAAVSAGRENRFEALVEAMADGVLLADWDGTLAYLNRAAETALGVDRTQLVGRHVSTLVERGVLPAADVEELVAATDDLRDGGTMVTHELEVAPDDGKTRVVELRVVPSPAETGFDGVLVTVRDVTRRRETELALRASRERVARLHEAATSIVACRDEDQLYDRAVAAAEGVLEFDVCSILVDDGERLVPRAVSSGATQGSARPFDPDEGLVGETYCTGDSLIVPDVREDETAEPVADDYRSLISVPVGDEGVFQATSTVPDAFDENDLELAELLMAHVTETLIRVRVEERLRDRERELVEERDRLAALFENVPDPCVAFDFEDGEPIVRAVNREFESVFGYDPETVVGENIDEFIVPAGYESEARELNETLQAGQRLRTTSKRRTADGIRDFLLHVVPFNVGERTVQGYAIYTDITEQKEHERKLRERNDRLDQFASMVSHDLRSPLNVAGGFLDHAEETGDPEAFDRIRDAHRRMDRLINDLLELARRGDVVDETRPTDLAAVAAGTWETVATADANLAVEGDATVDADPDRLVELFENLFRNSVEHGGPSGDGGGPRPVTVRIGLLEGSDDGESPAGFYVADDGVGIPEDERDRVFESGYTTRQDGTGLGLHIVREIARAHDWSVAVTDGNEGGARFEFRVPDLEDPAPADPR